MSTRSQLTGISNPQFKPASTGCDPKIQRRFPIGAEPVAGGGTHFRVWAPKCKRVSVELGEGDLLQNRQEVELTTEFGGYFSGHVQAAAPGMVYRFKLPSGSFPDPASRFQPEGPHGPSQIIDPSQYSWRDRDWRGISRSGQVIYELHIGTFTPTGTWAAAQQELPELAKLGITTIEVMPIAEFPGRFGWGYDGVDLFAPTHLYGRPDDFRRFVEGAHALGLGVILDVVYNHFGPDGNYLKNFSDTYFTDRYRNEWGEAINFDSEHCEPVREFFCANAAYWIDEFHLDGLRLDATQQIFDASPENIHIALMRSVRKAAGVRSTFVVAENEAQNATFVRPVDQGGYGLDAIWNDDWHHSAMVALSGHADAYYSDFKGSPQELISAAKWGFLYQGQRSTWQNKPRGSAAFGVTPEQFVNCLQNHDQVANSLLGKRFHQLTSPGRARALTALLLLAPATPMLFQGQEFAASTPFLYFADHRPDLARMVAEGRKNFLSQFSSIGNEESRSRLPAPHDLESFIRSKLDLTEREKNAPVYQMHTDLLKVRREDPVLNRPRVGGVDGAVLGPEVFALRFFSGAANDRLLVVNLGADFKLVPMSEPLLSDSPGTTWTLSWSSESPRYGGSGTPPIQRETGWRIPGHAALLFAAAPAGEGLLPQSKA
jgi:maltooligosyltrehalose trehalohydrolase